ncbi:MAG: CoA-binding protein [Mucilaginibacter polytrichastri]|nr:CoA-binding protein [Mucilaginibacter polytrichastri]
MSKKTVIIGATPNEDRYAYLAANRLVRHGHEIVNVGIKKGEVAGVPIEKAGDVHADVDTVTLYVGPSHQPEYYDYILRTKPKRIIFNPGTENADLEDLAQQNGIETVEGCTLVMLGSGQY